MQSFKSFLTEAKNRQPFSLRLYKSLLQQYLMRERRWKLESDGDITDSSGNRIGSIERKWKPSTRTFHLEMIAVAIDDSGERKKNLGLLRLIYTFEKSLIDKYDIDFITVEPLNAMVRVKLRELYSEFPQQTVGKKLIITVKR